MGSRGVRDTLYLSHSVSHPEGLKEDGNCGKSLIHLFGIPWTVACQALLSMEFSRQEYWSGLPFPSSGDLPHSGIEPRSPHCRQTLYHLSHQGSPKGVCKY